MLKAVVIQRLFQMLHENVSSLFLDFKDGSGVSFIGGQMGAFYSFKNRTELVLKSIFKFGGTKMKISERLCC